MAQQQGSGLAQTIHQDGQRVEADVAAHSPRAGALLDAGLRAVDRMTGYQAPPQPAQAPTPARATDHPYATQLETDLGQHVADGMHALNNPTFIPVDHNKDIQYYKGVQYTYNFRAWLDQLNLAAKATTADFLKTMASDPAWGPVPDAERLKNAELSVRLYRDELAQSAIKVWDDDYYNGYASPEYFERFGFMSWRLKPGKSASAAVKAWLSGLTLAECNTSMVTLEYDALRSKMGDAAFDHAFNAMHGNANALEIAPGTARTELFLTQTEGAKMPGNGVFGNRPAKVGEWYYFCNHPKYLLKHPGGAWQGENAILSSVKNGVQYWSGLGAGDMTEDAMLDEMVEAYNAPRDGDDARALTGATNANGGKLPPELDPQKKLFPDIIMKADILNAPPFEYGGQTRVGGFMGSVGMVIDPKSIARLTGKK